MNVILSPRTQKLLEKRMREADYPSADDLIRAALEALEGVPVEDLDEETQAAIERAEECEVHDAVAQIRQAWCDASRLVGGALQVDEFIGCHIPAGSGLAGGKSELT